MVDRPESQPDVVLVVPDYIPPAKNELTKGKVAVSARLRAECHFLFRAVASRERLRIATGFREVRLTITYPDDVVPSKRHDVDAFWQAVLDSLTQAQMILGDRYDQCRILPVVYLWGPRPETRVELFDRPDEDIREARWITRESSPKSLVDRTAK